MISCTCRLVFFAGLEDFGEAHPLLALRKSDKRASNALATLLRLYGQDDDAMELLEDCICNVEEMYDI